MTHPTDAYSLLGIMVNCALQWSSIITWSNITWYYALWHSNNDGITWAHMELTPFLPSLPPIHKKISLAGNSYFLSKLLTTYPIAMGYVVSSVDKKRPAAQIPQCTSPISHNGHMCAPFCYKMGLQDGSIDCGIMGLHWSSLRRVIALLFRIIWKLSCSQSWLIIVQI